jgi:translation initiation factor IF-2
MRLHELAKELETSSKELIEYLNSQGSNVASELAGLSDEELRIARSGFSPEARQARAEAEAKKAAAAEASATAEEEMPGEIEIEGRLIVRDFAEMLGMKPNRVIAELMKENVFASINDELDFTIAKKIAAKHDIELKRKKRSAPPVKEPEPKAVAVAEEKLVEDKPESQRPRAPVVSFLGHVDHGKTSLLDHIRKAAVAEGEAGGITQHIGAYTVDFHDHRITFLDTPGHAAFTAMRARGANLTDIVVLIVAADDGVMPQTKEAIQHAQAANVCIIVAANKMDLPGADINKVHQGLMEAGLMPEPLGGKVGVIPVSAKTGAGIEDLLEYINLESEMLELKANPNRPADGYVIEAQLEQGRGPTATLLVKGGTLKVGDVLVSGSSWGKIKALINDKGKQIRTAGPSDAVKCMGLNSVPEAGAKFTVKKDLQEAKQIAEDRNQVKRAEHLQRSGAKEITLDNLFAQAQGNEKKMLNLVLKCDVQGSLEAVEQMLDGIESEKVSLKKVLTSVGNITENDVLLAKATQSVVIGFNVAKEPGVTAAAKREGVEVRLYSIIYEMYDDVKASMTGLLEPEYREKPIGAAEVRQVFDIGKRGRIAGCMVAEGTITSNANARVRRDSDIIYVGKISSLKRFQNDAREVREGQECGIGFDNYGDLEVGDRIECYVMEKLEISL